MPAFNQSKIKMFRRCQKQFAFRYDYGADGKELVPKVPKVQLQRGTWLHALVEAETQSELNEAADWRVVHEAYTENFNKLFEEERVELGDLPAECERIFKAYLRWYAKDEPDRYTTAMLDDGKPAIEFVVEVDLPDFDEPFKGRLDRLVEDKEYGGLWIWDYKWVKTVPDDDERMMSPQAPMYVWALQEMGYDVRGFVYNYGRTKPPAIPQVLKRPAGSVSQRKNMDTDLQTYCEVLKQQYGDQWRVMAKTVYRDTLLRLKRREKLWFRRERIPVEDKAIAQCMNEFLITAGQITNRPDKDMAPRSYFYNCRFSCDYHDICVAEFRGLNIAPLVKKRYEEVPERYSETEDLLDA